MRSEAQGEREAQVKVHSALLNAAKLAHAEILVSAPQASLPSCDKTASLKIPWFKKVSRGLKLIASEQQAVLEQVRLDVSLNKAISDSFVRHCIAIRSLRPSLGDSRVRRSMLALSNANVGVSSESVVRCVTSGEISGGSVQKDPITEHWPVFFQHAGLCLSIVEIMLLRQLSNSLRQDALPGKALLARVAMPQFAKVSQRSLYGRPLRSAVYKKAAQLQSIVVRCLSCHSFAHFFRHISFEGAPQTLLCGKDLHAALKKMPNLERIVFSRSVWSCFGERGRFIAGLPKGLHLVETNSFGKLIWERHPSTTVGEPQADRGERPGAPIDREPNRRPTALVN